MPDRFRFAIRGPALNPQSVEQDHAGVRPDHLQEVHSEHAPIPQGRSGRQGEARQASDRMHPDSVVAAERVAYAEDQDLLPPLSGRPGPRLRHRAPPPQTNRMSRKWQEQEMHGS